MNFGDARAVTVGAAVDEGLVRGAQYQRIGGGGRAGTNRGTGGPNRMTSLEYHVEMMRNKGITVQTLCLGTGDAAWAARCKCVTLPSTHSHTRCRF